jgi:hypothetical protein
MGREGLLGDGAVVNIVKQVRVSLRREVRASVAMVPAVHEVAPVLHALAVIDDRLQLVQYHRVVAFREKNYRKYHKCILCNLKE